jgi:hypothetical protein
MVRDARRGFNSVLVCGLETEAVVESGIPEDDEQCGPAVGCDTDGVLHKASADPRALEPRRHRHRRQAQDPSV